jgi:hypothetical protein
LKIGGLTIAGFIAKINTRKKKPLEIEENKKDEN